MKKMKRKINCLLLALFFIPLGLLAQNRQIRLAEVEQWAAMHFPLLVQKTLANERAAVAKSNLGKNYLPQVNVNAQATWQNAVPELPVKIQLPGFEIDPVNKDQYRAIIDVSQLLYDGGSIRLQKQLAELEAIVKSLQTDAQFEPMRERVTQLYFSGLLVNEQKQLMQTAMEDIALGINKVEAQVQNGIAFRSHLATLQTEELKIKQQLSELEIQRLAILEMLSLFTGQHLDASVVLTDEKPEMRFMANRNLENRPEWKLFSAQDSLALMQATLADIRTRPKLSAFAQGGYGNPGLNMLKNEFSPMFMTGIRFNWNLSAFYSRDNDHKLASIQQREIAAQKENFIMQTNARLNDEATKMQRLEELLKTDGEIIVLRQQIKEASKAQLDHGVINANDYIREVNAENQAILQQKIHELQLLQAQRNYKLITGQTQ